MPKTLAGWESIIQPQFELIRLLGEIPLSRADVQEIGSLLRAEIKHYPNLRRATDWIVKQYPHTFAVFLAAFAAHNTEREFWEALGRLLDISGSDLNNANWRKHFIEILKQNNKRTFDDVGGVTKKYVTSMRIHGGIPAYSLRDFFENMLMPAVKKPEYRELSGQELLSALLNRSSVQLFTDSPVRDFFENSADIGLDFLENCRQLALRYNVEGGIPSGLDLPPYVCNAFADYVEDVGSEERRRLRRPRLLFDRDGEGLLLDLPEQPIRGISAGEAFWDITSEDSNENRREIVRIRRMGRDILTKQVTILLGPPAKAFQVTFVVKADHVVTITKTWILRLVLDGAPLLLVFRAQDYSLLRWSQALPAQPLLLVYPKDITLQFEGEAHRSDVGSLYAFGWQDWQAEVWSLEQAGALRLLKNGSQIDFISVQGQAEMPSLFGLTPFAPNVDSKPLYIGEIPNLRIPLYPGYAHTDELKRWRLELASLWDASPQTRKEFKLIEKASLLTYTEASVEVNMEALLGKDAVGTYALRVTNGQETDMEFHFRLWPSLRLDDLPPIILPPFPAAQELAPSSIAFRLTLPVAAACEPQAGAYGIAISGEYGRYRIAVDEDITCADLNLTLKKNDEQVIHVPLSVPIPRLEWRVMLGDEKAIQWTTRPLKRSLDVFLQAVRSVDPVSLLVRIFGFEQFSRSMVMHLVDSENTSGAPQEFSPEKSPLGSDYLRFVLNKAYDTLNENTASAFFEFQLTLLDPMTQQEVHLPLLLLPRSIEIREIILEQNSAGEPVLLWDEPHPVRHRRLFIRSPWQPWNPGWEVLIPDEARGELTLSGTGLPPSQYEVYFYTAHSWESPRLTPPEGPPHIVETIDPDKHILWLADQMQKHPNQSFRHHFERACVYETIGMTARRNEEIQYCYNQLSESNLGFLLAFHNWLVNYSESTQKAVRMKMYRPERLVELFAGHRPSSEFRRAYLKYVPVTFIQPDSATLLVKHEDDPLVVLHSLRTLIERHDTRSLGVIVALVESGRLADSDAADLLLVEREFSLSGLTASTPTPIHSRLLSRVLQHLEDKTAIIANFSNNQLVTLVEAETDPVAIKHYLTVLITREDVRGIEQAMRLFQNGFLLGNEVTDLLGHNARFAMRVLESAPGIQSYLAQASEVARQYPEQTGHVIPGMFVQVLDGWARITSIEDKDGQSLQIIHDDNCDVVLRLELQPNSASPLSAVLDRHEETLILPGGTKFYQCGQCDFIATSQHAILGEHTRRAHSGMGPEVRGLSSPILINRELKFSLSKS